MPDGLVIVDKPGGWTSHQVVGRLRRLLGTRKVGHAGTLDPMATGLLIVGVDRATRLLGHLALHDKRYLATIRLGMATTTDDAEGDPTSSLGATGVTEDDIEAAVAGFRGNIEQVPSAVSAIKVAGERAYRLVRDGRTPKLAPRSVCIARFDVCRVRPADDMIDVDVDVECSKGTYIRALARDVGSALGVGGHLTALRRTRIGPFTFADVDVSGPTLEGEGAQARVRPLGAVARQCFETLVVDDEIARRVAFGQTVPLGLTVDPTALLSEAGDLLGLYRPDGEWARPIAVLGGV